MDTECATGFSSLCADQNVANPINMDSMWLTAFHASTTDNVLKR